MPILRVLVRFGFVPFMLLGLNGAAYWVVSQGHSYAWLLPLLVVAFAAAHAGEHIAPWYEEWKSTADAPRLTALK